MHPINLIIATTTGAHLQVTVSELDTVTGLKYALARKFRLHVGRMSLLHKDRSVFSNMRFH